MGIKKEERSKAPAGRQKTTVAHLVSRGKMGQQASRLISGGATGLESSFTFGQPRSAEVTAGFISEPKSEQNGVSMRAMVVWERGRGESAPSGPRYRLRTRAPRRKRPW